MTEGISVLLFNINKIGGMIRGGGGIIMTHKHANTTQNKTKSR